MRLQPRKGRYFPIGVSYVAALTKAWHLGDWPANRRLCFENPDMRLHTRLPLVCLRPRRDLTIFSVPEDIHPELAKNAIQRAIDLCSSLNQGNRSPKGHVSESFFVYLTATETLTVVARRVHYQPTKYRSAQKFSTAGKPRIVRIEEIELQKVTLG